MADTTENIRKEQTNDSVDRLIRQTLQEINPESIKPSVKQGVTKFNSSLDRTKNLPSEEARYVRNLPEKEKQKVLRYLDIFQQDNTPALEYIQDLRKFGSTQEAKKQGSAKLHNPNKFLKEIKDNPEIEGDVNRLITNLIQGDEAYDISTRSDLIGEQKQKLYQGTKKYKIQSGIAKAGENSLRNAAITLGAIYDSVGGETDVITYIQNRWPEVEKSRQGIEQLSEDLTQFGISAYTGKKILGMFGKVAGKVAPGTVLKITEKLKKTKPVLNKSGKPVLDKFGLVKETSSVAQKMAYWGVPAAVGYGIGESLLRGEEGDKTVLGDAFGLVQNLKVKSTKGLTGREKATETLKNKLKFGVDGTAFVGGLTLGFKAAVPVLGGFSRGVLKPVFNTFSDVVINPISKVMSSESSQLPKIIRGLQKGGAWATTKAGIPPLEKWQYFSTTGGPLKEKIMAVADKFVLKPIRTRGALTPEAKDTILAGEDMVRKYQKSADISLKEIEAGIRKLLNIGFTDRIFTSSTSVAGKQYLDDIILFLQGKIPEKGLPEILRSPVKEIRKQIDGLTNKLKPYIKSEEIEKEFVDNLGKYLRNSYEIFRGSFKPNKTTIDANIQYFKQLIKSTDKRFKGKMTPEKEALLARLASQKVDEIIQVAQEGSSPLARMSAIEALVTPTSNLIKKNQSIPEVVQKLLGKVEDSRTIILDTITQQANLLSHIQVQKTLVEQGLKNGWIFKSPESFAKLGIQKEAARALVPVQIAKNRMNVDLSDVWSYSVGKNRSPYYVTREMAGALNGDALITDALLKIPLYKTYLAGKVTSQLTKTVLSLMTQARNVETAAFFSFINGHMGRNASVIDAFKIAFQDVTGKGGTNPTVMKKKLEEYLQYGVFDNSVVAAEVEAVMKDIATGNYKTTEALLKYLAQNPIFRKATEFYQAADNLWKAYGYEFTKSQLIPAIPVRGIIAKQAREAGHLVPKEITNNTTITWQNLVSQQFKEVFKKTWNPKNLDGSMKSHAEAVKEISARYIRDVYPNYSMVPQIVKEWRRLPLGNFVAFQSEIIRNIYHILSYSTREMGASNPFIRQMGARRFLGLSSVLYGSGKTIGIVSEKMTGLDGDFIKQYQRFLAPWYMKNARVFPITGIQKDGTFKTLNWSQEQPFESAITAFEIFSKEMFNPNNSDANMFDRFFKAMFYNFEEEKNGALTQLFEPFISPSILTEAIGDITPKAIGGRGGETLDNRRIYDSLNDEDGVIIAKIFNHLVQTINPTTFKQAGQLLSAIDGELDSAGKKYDTTEKILKLFLGLGYQTENPQLSYTYVVNNLSERLRAVDSNFSKRTLNKQLLRSNPRNIVYEFERRQKNRYREMSRIKDFLNLSEKLMTKQKIKQQFKGRQGFGTVTMNYLFRDKFRPSNLPSTKITSPLRKSLKVLQQTDPNLTFDDIYPRGQLIEIRNKWNNTPLGLTEDEIEKYHREKYGIKTEPQSSLPSLQQSDVQVSQAPTKPVTPPLPKTPTPVLAAQANPISATGLTNTEMALLSPSEQAIRLRQRG